MFRHVLLPAAVFSTAGCVADSDDLRWLTWQLQALCTVNVEGSGIKQVETDYLPHVVACENGAADPEALRAQAVAARSYMYYEIKSPGGSICDGTGCQVYTCSNKPSQVHYDAVAATAGQVLVYSGVVICAFYVAGAKPTSVTCQAAAGDPDPTFTEKYVTYNEGQSGSGITQTTLGLVAPGSLYNRGCKSQNGAHCLASNGRPYPDILRFYYGADIQLVTATGSCVSPPPPDAASPPLDAAPPSPDAAPPPPDAALPAELAAPRDQQPLPGDWSTSGEDGSDRDQGAWPSYDVYPGSRDLPPPYHVTPQLGVRGGCAVALTRGQPPGLAAALLVLAAGGVTFWRRKRRA